MPRVLIIEDEVEIASTIEYALKTEGFEVEHVLNGGDGLKKFAGADLIVLDVGLPDISGFDVCREIRKESEVPIIFLTARADEIDRIVGLELGADDYVSKPFSPRELAARVKAVLRRGSKSSESLSLKKVGAFEFCDDRKEVQFHGKALFLSPNEYKMILLLAQNQGRVFSREQIMNRVWDEPGFSTERTVDTHIKTLRSKLKAISEEEVIETHRGFGYCLRI
jgi:two-component system, OmpR family, catabolic regulation response regulator CreB